MSNETRWERIVRIRPFATNDPVRIAQRLIAANATDDDRLADVVGSICTTQLWKKRRGPDGAVFEKLAHFVIAPAPFGLEVQTEAALRRLRAALLNRRLFREWIEVREGVVRPPGYSKANIAHSEVVPIFKASTSSTAVDQILPRLMRDHEKLFQLVEAGELSIHRAGLQAGLVRRYSNGRRGLRFGAVDFNALQQLSPAARTKLLRMVFDAVGVDAQCGLLASRLDGIIGHNIAVNWRNKTDEPEGGAS